ncbi:MAG: DUF1932 domain-containing protein [Burkholderiaceae bacterium]|nr:NAD(P)-dependent oxidoreductase [Rhodoferax sp.]MCB2027583.1 NAD(P)-dependent oxidoreductase [Rhodoferax sp.]MCB2040697.1 NAD(P)-dependent oxidoreductase [Rhodoferax sp.]MCP5467605.1 NAD(P)-dependent oxidoreductase [Nevskiaceae bacterium]MCW5627532.1 NAD(P)-dependent oxidoreductase [Rhodoferax sp.]
MRIETIGLMTPGDMGQAVAQQLQAGGFDVCTALEGRSERSHALAREAGLRDLGSIRHLVDACDVVLSIMNPGAAVDFARQAAEALRTTGRHTLIVDCNAIAPDTVHGIAAEVQQAGGRFLDGGIIGPPPRGSARTRLYVSGPGAADLEPLAGPQLQVQVVSERIGDASALKMCFAGLNKGTQLLWLEIQVAAQHLGIADLLERQLGQSLGGMRDWSLASFPLLPAKAYRWEPEMREIAKTLGAAGITPKVFEGAADICAFVAQTAMAQETPENRDPARDGQAVVRALAAAKAGTAPTPR